MQGVRMAFRVDTNMPKCPLDQTYVAMEAYQDYWHETCSTWSYRRLCRLILCSLCAQFSLSTSCVHLSWCAAFPSMPLQSRLRAMADALNRELAASGQQEACKIACRQSYDNVTCSSFQRSLHRLFVNHSDYIARVFKTGHHWATQMWLHGREVWCR